MRTVAVVIAALTLVALYPPVASANDCANAGSGSLCVEIPASRPNSPPGVPSLPPTPYWGKYYLWIGAGHCTTGDLADCRGHPATGPVGVDLPDQAGGGTAPGLGVIGMLYEETNGMNGLQRFFTSRPGDRMVLV